MKTLALYLSSVVTAMLGLTLLWHAVRDNNLAAGAAATALLVSAGNTLLTAWSES